MSYADIVLDDSPLLYWPMTSGTAVDSSGNGYHGTSVGSPQAESAGPATCHHADGSTSFDADEATPPYLYRSTSPLSGTGDFTAEIWLRPDVDSFTRPTRPYQTIFQQRLVGRVMTGFFRLSMNGAAFVVFLNGSKVIPMASSSIGERTECWTHLVVRRSGTAVTLKMNGSTIGSAASSGTITDQHLSVAVDYSDMLHPPYSTHKEEWELWKGQLAHFALYDTALSDARIAARVAAGCTQCGETSSWHIGSLRFGSTAIAGTAFTGWT